MKKLISVLAIVLVAGLCYAEEVAEVIGTDTPNPTEAILPVVNKSAELLANYTDQLQKAVDQRNQLAQQITQLEQQILMLRGAIIAIEEITKED